MRCRLHARREPHLEPHSSRAPAAKTIMAQAGSGTRRVLVGHGLNRDSSLESVLLPHPATGRAAAFLLSPDGGLLELNHLKSEFTSWFVGDSVVEGARGPGTVAAVVAWLTDPAHSLPPDSPCGPPRPKMAACTQPRCSTSCSCCSQCWSTTARRFAGQAGLLPLTHNT